nr:hypothetical protein CFP56_73861 [Quercus suber]
MQVPLVISLRWTYAKLMHARKAEAYRGPAYRSSHPISASKPKNDLQRRRPRTLDAPSPVATFTPTVRDKPLDPITRTALRYTISPREYALLHQYLISRAPRRVQKQTPDPPQYENITASTSETSDYNAAALRAALRTFIATYVGMKGYDAIIAQIAARRSAAASPVVPTKVVARPKHPNARLALSFSMIMLFHRIFHRFFRRLRGQLLQDTAEPFRKRNPGVARLLTSTYTPAVGASLAGFFLGLAPAEQLRMTLAIYVLTRSLEFGYNALEDGGMLWKKKDGEEGSGRPWWFGSWMIMPVVCGQLLHAFVFDRECFPESYGRFILSRSPEYIQLRPASYTSVAKPWPGTFDIVDALAELSKLKWPAFVSPILFPAVAQTLPKGAALSRISPITAPAHPALSHTSCAILHPHDPSCARTYLKFWLAAFPSVAKFFTLVYGAFALLAYKALLKDPMPFLNRLAARVLRMALFVTGAIGTSWGSICLFAALLPAAALPTQRWFLGGALGGLWAIAHLPHHRPRPPGAQPHVVRHPAPARPQLRPDVPQVLARGLPVRGQILHAGVRRVRVARVQGAAEGPDALPQPAGGARAAHGALCHRRHRHLLGQHLPLRRPPARRRPAHPALVPRRRPRRPLGLRRPRPRARHLPLLRPPQPRQRLEGRPQARLVGRRRRRRRPRLHRQPRPARRRLRGSARRRAWRRHPQGSGRPAGRGLGGPSDGRGRSGPGRQGRQGWCRRGRAGGGDEEGLVSEGGRGKGRWEKRQQRSIGPLLVRRFEREYRTGSKQSRRW